MNRTFVSLPLLSLVAVIVTGFVMAALLSQGVVSRADEMMPAADMSAVDSVSREYGIVTDGYDIVRGTVEPGQNLSSLLQGCGLSAADVHVIGLKAEGTFDARRIRSGQGYAVFYTRDSVPAARYFVYEETPRTYVVFDLGGGFGVSRGTNPVEWRQMSARCRVESSLWVAMDEAGASPLLAVTLSHIFGWSVDFFGLQRGDEFRVIYEQEYVDGAALDNFRVLAASFAGGDTAIYAIPFVQDGEQLYYNTDGNSLEGAFLKAPLDFYRITSRFTNSRFHPVLRRYRAHHGVDYAAPAGTPVYAIGDGTVTAKAFQAGGAGNYVKIRHNSVYTTTYMHLSRFAKGLKVGSRVRQKEVIGYVGSTGLSTGPHLDFRVYENGKPINPLLIKSQPKRPIAGDNRAAFAAVCDSLVAALRGVE